MLFPALTSSAGFPAEYEAFTIPGPPVAIITFTSSDFIRAFVPSIDGIDIRPRTSAHRPRGHDRRATAPHRRRHLRDLRDKKVIPQLQDKLSDYLEVRA